MDVVPDVLVECETRRSACHHSTLRPPAKSPLTCLNTQIHSREGIQPFTKLHNLSIRNDMNLSETTTNRKVRSHLVRKQHINCHFMFFFYCFWSFLDFFLLFFVLFCFQISLFLAFSWLYTGFVWFYAFSLIVFGPGTSGQAGSRFPT